MDLETLSIRNAEVGAPGNGLIASSDTRTSWWRWPGYARLLAACRNGPKLPSVYDTLGWPKELELRRLGGLSSALALAGFIEWKYFAVLSPSFHGIIGLSLYNPDARFPHLAEGGLLLVVAGTIGGDTPAPFVDMHLLPTATLQGLEGPRLQARHGDVSLDVLDDAARQRSSLVVTVADRLRVEANFSGAALQTEPYVAASTCPLALSHWIVHNRMPCASTDGCISVARSITHAQHDRTESWSNSAAYFEHAWGLHPLPWQGWDFMFAPGDPNLAARPWAVLQSYRNMSTLTRLDLGWLDGSTGHAVSSVFKASELDIKWGEEEYDVPLAAWIPKRRVLVGRNASHTVRLENSIDTTLRFLRPQTPAVRCFFIGEQLGSASWSVYDHQGQPVMTSGTIRAGGEIAYARFPSLGRVTHPFPVKS